MTGRRRERATLGIFRPRSPEARPIPSPMELLAFEAEHTAHTGAKELLIRSHFGFPPARYYQLLSRAVHDPAAVAAHPSTARIARDMFERNTR